MQTDSVRHSPDVAERFSLAQWGRNFADASVGGLPSSMNEVEAGREQRRQAELMAAPVVLCLCHVEKSYPIAGSEDRVVALKDINLNDDSNVDGTPRTAVAPGRSGGRAFDAIRRGEFVMIRGPSGGGKTTLLNMIGTIDSPTGGSIELLGESIDGHTAEGRLADIRLKTLGFVFQTFNLIATMTASENVELPMTLLGTLSSREIRLRARQLLTLVGLRNRVNHLPSELSGGEQQRVTIARSLANNPVLLLLDEPTGDLDTTNTIEVMDLLIRINRRSKTTCLMVTHNPDVECYADRILYVADGQFQREVRNPYPTCLNAEAYAEYLSQKERESTSLTHILSRENNAQTPTSRRLNDPEESLQSNAQVAEDAPLDASSEIDSMPPTSPTGETKVRSGREA